MPLDTMRAYVMNKVGDAEVKDRPIPVAGPNSAIVKTTLALVCTSDVHTIHGGLGEIVDRRSLPRPRGSGRDPLTWCKR